jgi:N-acetyl-gamma-glutamyl-phosphate reductase
MAKIKVGIINVTGYAGIELARIIARHPMAELSTVTGRSSVGQRLSDVFPHLADIDLPVVAEVGEVDVVFSAMPHKESVQVLLPFVEKGVRVIDISADFRLKERGDYPEWYDFVHPAPELLEKAVYGLPEFHRDAIAGTKLVANPGCYPTGALLALAPVVKEKLISPDIIVDSKSGASGAGRSLSLITHYAEVNESVSAYALKGHRHLPEIIQEVKGLSPGFTPAITFIPHLVPMTRGILSSCYAGVSKGSGQLKASALLDLYRDFYKNEPFVKVVNEPPSTKQTWGSNLCLVHPAIDSRTGRIMVISCIDNLVKGAAGQAIQNMNIMFGFPETAGLDALPVYP